MEKNITKAILIMSVRTFLAAFICCVFVSVLSARNTSAQSIKEVVISVDFNRASLSHVFNNIEEKTEFTFLYDKAKITSNSRRVTLRKERATVAKILQQITRQTGVTFRQVNNSIAVQCPETTPMKSEKQTGTIKGEVTDAQTGKTLPGANVYLKGDATIGATTDKEGNYTINNVEAGTHTLVASFVGYKRRAKKISVREGEVTEVNFNLNSAPGKLGEMVVIGYGSERKKDVTGSIASIDDKELMTSTTANSFDQLLGGKLSGVQVSQVSGKAGEGAIVNIRGVSSVSGANQPLYVIDGVPVQPSQQVGANFNSGLGNSGQSNPLLSIDPHNIESVNVLKDASAAAIYGSRAANGVVIITTKRGARTGNQRLKFGYTLNVKRFINSYELMNAKQYKQYAKTLAKNTLEINPVNTNAQVIADNTRSDGEPYFGSGNTNWIDQITRSSALTHNFNLSYGGGSDVANYYLALNTRNSDEMFKRSNFKSYNVRANIDANPTSNLSLSASLAYNYNKNESGNAGSFSSAFFFQPTYKVRNQETYTSYQSGTGGITYNPVARNNEISNNQTGNNLIGSANVALDIIKGLELKSKININLRNTDNDNYTSNIFQRYNSNLQGRRELGNYKYQEVAWENTLSFKRSIQGIHNINSVIGASTQRTELSTYNINAIGFSNDAINGISAASKINRKTQDKQIGVLNSYFLRFKYNYKEKYYITFTGRADGSSKFGPNDRWGYFPSTALAWNISNEPFLKSSDLISHFKLRVSYGETGLDNLPEYLYERLYAVTDSPHNNSYYNGTPGLLSSGIPNKSIHWETSKQFDAGLEFGFFQDRLKGSIDYYRKKSSGQILNSTISPSTGYLSQNKNVGDIINKGIELDLSGDIIQKRSFNWHSSINISFNKNKLDKLGGGTLFDYGNPGSVHVGEPLGNIRGYIVDGFFQNQKQIDNLNSNAPDGTYQSFSSEKVGNYRYKDVNGDGQITSDDQVNLGNTQPDFYGGLSNTLSYKNWDLLVNFQFSHGIDKIWGDQGLYLTSYGLDKNNLVGALEDTWSKDNRDAYYQRAYLTTFRGAESNVSNSRKVYDASYLRLKVARLTYHVSSKLLGRVPVNKARIYISATNLWTLTNWPGLDPEIISNGLTGLATYNTTRTLDGYPLTRAFTLGINISL